MLPIYEIEKEIIASFAKNQKLILSAPTGSGKSTQIPQILQKNKISQKKILVLQPRRLAAIMLANRVAEELGEKVGNKVGYITRFEKSLSAKTEICFVTTGILPRILLSDKDLSEFDTIIFDEFHERSCLQDIALALVREILLKRKDLKLLIMSATLEIEQLKKYLENAEVLQSNGKIFPVDISYLPPKSSDEIWEIARKALVQILNSKSGDILIFMPGAYEINKTIEKCKEISCKENLVFLPLYGNLPENEQKKIMEKVDGRKIIVATNIAETSVTISGVRHVIDSGKAKVNRFHPTKMINMLEEEQICDFSAEQRAGRAGREDAGTCIRLWRENPLTNKVLDPEIRRIDLAETVLLLARFGWQDLAHFPWFSEPRDASINFAIDLLKLLKFIDSEGKITKEGTLAVELPIHPRLAKMIIMAEKYSAVQESIICAALLSERSILQNGKNNLRRLASYFDAKGESSARKQRVKFVENTEEIDDSDLIILIKTVLFVAQRNFDLNLCRDLGINRSAVISVCKTADHIATAVKKIFS